MKQNKYGFIIPDYPDSADIPAYAAANNETMELLLDKILKYIEDSAGKQQTNPELDKKLDGEISDREAADKALQKSISDETANRKSADDALTLEISGERSARESMEEGFLQRLNNMYKLFANELKAIYYEIGVVLYDGGAVFDEPQTGNTLDGGLFTDEPGNAIDCGGFEPLAGRNCQNCECKNDTELHGGEDVEPFPDIPEEIDGGGYDDISEASVDGGGFSDTGGISIDGGVY